MDERTAAIILLGPPGSGKTTLTDRLASREGMEKIETGQLLREEVENGTPEGRGLKPYLDSGKLAPSNLVSSVVAREIERVHPEKIIFGGFPRREEEITPFFRMAGDLGFDLTAVLVFNLPDHLVVKRLTGHRVCPSWGAICNVNFDPPKRPGTCDECGVRLEQRRDDEPDLVRQRLETHKRETIPVIEYFRESYAHLTHEESAEKPLERIIASVLAIFQ